MCACVRACVSEVRTSLFVRDLRLCEASAKDSDVFLVRVCASRTGDIE